jgi:uncharacterized membrane protein YfcA
VNEDIFGENAVDVPTLLLIAVLGIASGLMIGCVGIGGVILVPALVFSARVPIEVSIPAAMIAYIVSGLVATAVFARNKSIHWSMAGWLCAGAAPTAFAGAWAVSVVSPLLLETGLGLLTLFSGLNSLRTTHVSEDLASSPSNKGLVLVGAVTGFLSSVSRTGGPLVLVPILIAKSVPVLTAVGLSQAIQIPIGVAATLGNVVYGQLNLELGGLLAASLTAGTWYGARRAHVVRRETLRRTVAVLLVVVGSFILGNVVWRLAG